ncbi:hypothetical protein [Mucisphaera sp.]|uniref:hypothetical protein n=1 Tax=Mucisphaera sp. TaxID=2913024 RepID=UPI003D10C22D
MLPARTTALLLTAVLLGTGCAGSQENNNLRRERAENQDTIARLTEQLRQTEAEAAALRQQLGRTSAVDNATTPVLTEITLGRLSGPIDTNADGNPDTLRLYASPRDDRGRFRAISGKASLTVTAATPGDNPRFLASRDYNPNEFDAAYRSGFTGHHYTFELPLDPAQATHATATLTVTDAESGIELTTQKNFELK